MVENHVFKMELGGRELIVESGKYCGQAGGSCIVRCGETAVMVTATAAKEPREGIDFFPLSIEFEEKMYSVGKIPGGFIKREGRPSEKAILSCRLIDRPLRPLFPKVYFNDVQVIATVLSVDPEIPPTAKIEGVDLVTEGVITMSRVLEYAKDYLQYNEKYTIWSYKKDGASQIARILFEEATDINFYVGRAINPAHQNPKLPIDFNIKMRLVDELSQCLKQMGKKIKVSYF